MNRVDRLTASPDGSAPGVLRLEGRYCQESGIVESGVIECMTETTVPRDRTQIGRIPGRWIREKHRHRLEFESKSVRGTRAFSVESQARFGTQFTLLEERPDSTAVEIASAQRPDALVPSLQILWKGDTGLQETDAIRPKLFLRRAALWGHRFLLTDDAEVWASIEPKDLQLACPHAEATRPIPIEYLAFCIVLVWISLDYS